MLPRCMLPLAARKVRADFAEWFEKSPILFGEHAWGGQGGREGGRAQQEGGYIVPEQQSYAIKGRSEGAAYGSPHPTPPPHHPLS